MVVFHGDLPWSIAKHHLKQIQVIGNYLGWNNPLTFDLNLQSNKDMSPTGRMGVQRMLSSAPPKNNTEPKMRIQLMEEILHQLIGSLVHYLQGFIHPRWLFGISSINSISKK